MFLLYTYTSIETIATADPKVAFKDVDLAIMVGAMPRREGMLRKDLLKANVKIFEVQGKALDEVAKRDVKVQSTDTSIWMDATFTYK